MIDIRVCQIIGWPDRTTQIPFHSTLHSYGLWNFRSFTSPLISQLTQLLFCASCSNTLTHHEVPVWMDNLLVWKNSSSYQDPLRNEYTGNWFLVFLPFSVLLNLSFPSWYFLQVSRLPCSRAVSSSCLGQHTVIRAPFLPRRSFWPDVPSSKSHTSLQW